jgi:hypothetical protein
MGLTVTNVAMSPVPASAAEADLVECTPTSPYVYSLRSPDGVVGGQRVNRVERIDVTTGEVDLLADFTPGVAPAGQAISEQVNSLGIRRDEQGRGRWLVFSTSNIGDLDATRNVYQYDLLTEELTSTRVPNEIWAADSNHVTRHGAIDLSTGVYYTATHRNNTDEFTLIAYDLDTEEVWLAGHLATPGASGSSGDMAFDSQGNLYFVVGGQSSARQFTAPAGSLPASPGEQIELTLTNTGGAATDEAATQHGQARTNGVGVAFGPYGYLYETFASGYLYRVDPSTGQVVPDDDVRPQDVALVDLGPAQPGSSARGGSSTDLATCASPNTLEVHKVVNHRDEETDQFTLSAARDDGVAVGVPVTTTGTEDGLQAEHIGPVGILALHEDGTTPWSHTITETGTAGADLTAYETSYRCVDRNDPTWGPYEGVLDGDSRSFTVPTPPREMPGGSRAIVCTVTNADPGNPVIRKVFDADTPQAAVDDVPLTGTYRCEDAGDPVVVNEGIWSVRGTGPALITPNGASSIDVPIGSVCQIWEDPLDDSVFPDDSWSWGTPAFDPQTPGDPSSGTVTIADDDTLANTITVTNAARQTTGPLQITKAFTGDVPAWVEDVTFTGTYSCAYPGLDGVPGTDDDIVNTGTWQVTGTGDAELTGAADLPVNSTCTVTEDTPSDEDLPDDAWQWLTPTFDPATDAGTAGQITIRDPDTNRVTVTNAVSTFQIVKAFPNGVPAWLDEVTYTGTYTCDADGTEITGSWQITGDGVTQLTPDDGNPPAIPPGAVCTATEDTLDPADLPDDTWAWDEPVLSPGQVTIGPNLATNTITVTNTATQTAPTVTLTIDKTLPDGAPTWLDDITYTGTWACGTVNAGTWTVTGNGDATLTPQEGSTDLPVGAECTVTEDPPPAGALPDSSWAWADPVIAPVPLTLTAEGDNTVTVSNSVSRVLTDLTVQKLVADSSPDWLNDITYTGTWTCTLADETTSGTWTITGTGTATLTPEPAIPAGAGCTITEDPLDDADLPDESWEWVPPSIESSNVVIAPNDPDAASAPVTVTNAVQRVTTSLTIDKSFPDTVPSWANDKTFTGNYACELGLQEETGIWTVTGPGTATLIPDEGSSSALPVGASCTITEDPPPTESLPDSSWAWAAPVIDPVPLQLTLDGSNTVTVTNDVTRITGTLTITKTLTDTTPGWADDLDYTGTWTCILGDEENTGTWTITGPGTANLTPNEGSTTELPLGSECTATEDSLDPDDLPNGSWAWSEPVIDPAQVVISAQDPAQITVTNSASQSTTGLTITKAFPDDAPAWLDDITYTGAYTCTLAATDYTGTWTVTGPGVATITPTDGSAPELPVSAECTITENPLDAAALPDASWSWDTPVITPGTITIGPDADENTVTITNSATRVTGTLEITKTLTDTTPDWADDLDYTGTWTCILGDEENTGTWTVTGPGDAAITPAEGSTTELPVGSSCSVTESELPPLPDASWAWGQPVISPGSADVTTDDPASFTVANTPTRVTGALQIVKDLADGSPDRLETNTYTGTWTCTLDVDTTTVGTWTITGTGTATLTPEPTIPAGAECTITENPLNDADLPDSSWHWLAPTIDIPTITIDPDADNTPVTVTNTAEQTPEPTPTPTPSPTTTPTPTPLPSTGANIPIAVLAIAAGSLLTGAILLLAARRRHSR